MLAKKCQKKKFAAHHTKGIKGIKASFSIHDVDRHKHSDKLSSYFYKAINIEISMAHVSNLKKTKNKKTITQLSLQCLVNQLYVTLQLQHSTECSAISTKDHPVHHQRHVKTKTCRSPGGSAQALKGTTTLVVGGPELGVTSYTDSCYNQMILQPSQHRTFAVHVKLYSNCYQCRQHTISTLKKTKTRKRKKGKK